MNHIENLKILYYSGFVKIRFGVDKDGSAYAIVHQEMGSIHITANCNGKLTAITHYEMNVTNALYNLFKIYFKLDRYDVHINLDDVEYVNTDIINSASTVTLSPGITISTPSGSFTAPVTSVVLK